MAKKKGVRKPTDYSLAQLQQLVEGKQSELADLKARRAELRKKLNELDQFILKAEGSGKAIAHPVTSKPAAQKKKRVAIKPRAKNQRSAKDYAIEILGKEKKGLPLKELADQVLASGYQSNSTNFSLSLYQVLHNARNKGETFMVDEKSGNWVLRK
jgi:hypothetical protein